MKLRSREILCMCKSKCGVCLSQITVFLHSHSRFSRCYETPHRPHRRQI